MNMDNENDTNRVGIYTQVSVETTATGEGLAPQGDKSPVAKTNQLSEYFDENTSARPENGQGEGQNEEEDARSQMGEEKGYQNMGRNIKRYPRCKAHYGKARWDEIIKTLKNIGFANWEANVMLAELDKMVANNRKACSNNTGNDSKIPSKVPRLEENSSETSLLAWVNIGDANHPQMYILPEYRFELEKQITSLLKHNNSAKLIRANYSNNLLLLELNNQQSVEFLKQHLAELNSLWKDANLVVCERVADRREVKFFIPHKGMPTTEILRLIKAQNHFETDEWTVVNREDVNDGISLHVEVDGATNIRLFKDQCDVHFLLNRVTVTLPEKSDVDVS